jgi:diaminopimelate decarboxylase
LLCQVLPINEKNTTGVQAQWDLVGPICETGDFLAKNRALPLSEGDYLALMSISIPWLFGNYF